MREREREEIRGSGQRKKERRGRCREGERERGCVGNLEFRVRKAFWNFRLSVSFC